ncbi:MAG TPA: S-methyl-5-thioribose-1-phosphate isomerase [Chloroflexota bacterium]|nr:S-methyl-5-thioribose-1-phosphate isomerase [Chloroflexota bacterium]
MNTLEWRDGALVLIDQRRLPNEIAYDRCADVASVARAISELRVRGAPAIGVAAAYGLVLAANASRAATVADLRRDLDAAAARLRVTRPTAVNLAWALGQMLVSLDAVMTVEGAREALLERADALARDDLASCRRIGANGADLLPEGARVLTHCNAGALATVGYGTALGVIRAAHERGRIAEVLVDETRPVLQGARLTAWELMRDGIPAMLIADAAAGHYMARRRVDVVVVGADRVAANGDVANKIGTYSLAVLAQAHGLPFYVAAPTSTIDLAIPSGEQIPIEERDPAEVTTVGGRRIAPEGVKVGNPAFDVTPARYVSALVTDRGVARPPYEASLRRLLEAAAVAVA